MKDWAAELQRRRAERLYRERQVIETPQGTRLRIGARTLLSFCSNDYLGLANHPRVVEALQAGAQRFGAGSGAAHLVTGHSAAHHALEEELAAFVGRPRALLFATGYMANLGVVSALLEKGDVVLEDRLNHASLLDAGLLSGARFVRYRHADAGDLGHKLASYRDRPRLVVTDGVFSMDGDVAPLPELVQQTRAQGAWLMVDDAHGLGVLGQGGRGSLAHFGLSMDEVPVLVGTLGKAFGTFGAFVAGGDDLVETVIQRARSYIYTTAPPPAVAEATRAALHVAEEESWRREQVLQRVQRFRQGARELGLPLLDSGTPIQPLMAGASATALRWQEALRERDILVAAIRPPTVPKGTARLRITFSAAHAEADVDRLLAGLEEIGCGQASAHE